MALALASACAGPRRAFTESFIKECSNGLLFRGTLNAVTVMDSDDAVERLRLDFKVHDLVWVSGTYNTPDVGKPQGLLRHVMEGLSPASTRVPKPDDEIIARALNAPRGARAKLKVGALYTVGATPSYKGPLVHSMWAKGRSLTIRRN